jgi:hypothetical protein
VIIDVDLTSAPAAIELVKPGDCTRFHMEARGGDPEVLAAALAAAGVGRLLPSGEAMIDTQSVRRWAEGRVPADWDDHFDAMLRYAKGKGWLDDSGESLQAHVEWAT